MIATLISNLLWLVALVLLQAVVLDNILLAGIITPLLYVYFVLRLDGGTPRYAALLWAFVLGLSVDVVQDIPGVNASATVLLAFLCPSFVRLFAPREQQFDASFVPSVKQMGVGSYFKFALLSILTHHAVVILLEYFSFDSPLVMLGRLLGTTALTLALVMSIEWFRR